MSSAKIVMIPKCSVIVNYGLNLAKMIELGRYDYKNDDITAKNFPIEGKGEVLVDLALVHFGKDIATKDAEQKIADQGLQPAKIEHLLALGAQLPDLQSEFTIVALGSGFLYSGYRLVPCLEKALHMRGLNLRQGAPDYRWEDGFRFLALLSK